MSKTIRLEDEVYVRLEATRTKRETFSQAVSKLLDLLARIGELMSTIQGQRAYAEYQKRELGKLPFQPLVSADGVRRDAEARTLVVD